MKNLNSTLTSEQLIQRHKAEELKVLMKKGLTLKQAKKLADIFRLSEQTFGECGKFAALLKGETIVDDEISFVVREVFIKLIQINSLFYEITTSSDTKKLFEEAVEELPDETKHVFDAIEEAVNEEEIPFFQLDFEGVPVH